MVYFRFDGMSIAIASFSVVDWGITDLVILLFQEVDALSSR